MIWGLIAPWTEEDVHNVQAELCFHKAFDKQWWITDITENWRVTYYLPLSLLLPTNGLVLLDAVQRKKGLSIPRRRERCQASIFPTYYVQPLKLAGGRSLRKGVEVVTILPSPLFKWGPPFPLHRTDTTWPGWVDPLHRASLQLCINCYSTFSGMTLAYGFQPQISIIILSGCQRNRNPYNSNSMVYQDCVFKSHLEQNLKFKKHSPLYKIFPVVHTLLLLEYC